MTEALIAFSQDLLILFALGNVLDGTVGTYGLAICISVMLATRMSPAKLPIALVEDAVFDVVSPAFLQRG